jgi:glycolate dehydrogenase FAD-binding subunit
VVTEERPSSLEAAAEVLRACNDDERVVRFVGGGTKLAWGHPGDAPSVELSTRDLDRVVEHNSADLTAIVEAGTKLAQLQAVLAEHGQMLALDPPDGDATIGGVVATSDNGPLRHRYGAARDLIVGATLVLADGTIAKSGGTVIKNVAGYDLAKFFAGSFGTLGLIGRVAFRLHPKPPSTCTVRAPSDDVRALQNAVLTMARLPLEADSLDISWVAGSGEVLVRFSGSAPAERARQAARELGSIGLDAMIDEEDDALWARQRNAQRSGDGATVRVSALPSELARVLAEAQKLGGRVVGRGGSGISFVGLAGEPDDLTGTIEELRQALAPWPCVVADAPDSVRAKIDVWGVPEDTALGLMRRIKERFDPKGICNRGIFVGNL